MRAFSDKIYNHSTASQHVDMDSLTDEEIKTLSRICVAVYRWQHQYLMVRQK